MYLGGNFLLSWKLFKFEKNRNNAFICEQFGDKLVKKLRDDNLVAKNEG